MNIEVKTPHPKTTARRRMRRTGMARCPQRAASPAPNAKDKMLDAQYGSPLKSETANPVNPVNPVKTPSATSASKRPRAHPFETLPEFASLTRPQLAYVHDILRTKTLEDAQVEIWTELGLQTRLDLCTLHRYKHKLLLAESLDLVGDAISSTTAIDQLNDLFAGRPTQLSATGLAVVQQRALALANDPKTKPSLFASLHRIFTYDDRREENHRRLQLAAEREATRKELAGERKTMNAHKRALDLEKIELARQREQNRHQLAAERLAFDKRKQDHQEALNQPEKPFDQDRMTREINALMAAGAELVRLTREARAAGVDPGIVRNVFNSGQKLSEPETQPIQPHHSP
jgi:hypothetical protein